MLAELLITDFAIIDELRLKLAPGFNVLTGETGAGKSIIIDAVGTLLGGRVETQMVRAGTARAAIEGMFYLDDATRAAIDPILKENDLVDDEEPDMLLLSREIRAGGRSTSRVNGRVVTTAILKSIGEVLVDIHGQSEHLSLLRPKEHVNLLDRYAETWEARQRLASVVAQWRSVRKELDTLLRSEAELARRADLLKFQVEEIGDARLKEGEEEALTAERNRLANAETLASLADEAYAALYEGAGETPAALDALAQARKAIAGLAKIDPSLARHSETIESVNAQIDDLAREISDYRDRIEYSPQRLEFVEERLDLIKRLKRKYAPNGSIADVLAFAQKAAEELDTIEHSGERVEELRDEEERLLREIGLLGKQLSEARRAAADRLSAGIEAELNDLRMSGARFAVDMKWEAAEEGAFVEDGRFAFDMTGLDKIEFLIAPNIGEGLKPLAKIASGGETSRLMLALKNVLSRADQTPTLIFDEIDQGIGGRVGVTVGHKLWGLSGNHQVVCITHLPQLAGYGDAHFKVEKIVDGERTVTRVGLLEGETRIEELAQMLGASGEGATLSAQEILAGVAEVKTKVMM
ncbi:MAG TPA: DNA repair protein RecN [Anaerolineae bacterium]|nr:DNA repair protein RecN [Anaerolineae bacterium]